MTGDSAARHVPVAIVGSGFSGLCAAIRLDKAEHRDFATLGEVAK